MHLAPIKCTLLTANLNSEGRNSGWDHIRSQNDRLRRNRLQLLAGFLIYKWALDGSKQPNEAQIQIRQSTELDLLVAVWRVTSAAILRNCKRMCCDAAKTDGSLRDSN